MTLAEQLYAVLSPLAAGGAWPLIAAQGTPTPYIVYGDVISTTENSLQGASALQNARMQIDGYQTSYAAMKSLGTAITAAMAAWAVTNVKLSEQVFFEADTRLYRVSLDYSIWSTS